mmetsp:Transcript_34037/g.78472  ORF Transcript_34037/g.78472 Transcript_34037/m.78472 type:complete len:291 (+) Transcript_34037:3-875(+)
MGNRYVTPTLVRRSIAGDAGSLHRLLEFLTSWGIINEDAINDSAPTPKKLRMTDPGTAPAGKKPAFQWTPRLRGELAEAVIQESMDGQQGDEKVVTSIEEDVSSGNTPTEAPTIDWQAVANRVGSSVTAMECERAFLTLDFKEGRSAETVERSITPEVAISEESKPTRTTTESVASGIGGLEEILAESDMKVVDAAIRGAFSATRDVKKAQMASITALVAKKCVDKAQSEEELLSHVLAELNEKRMQKIENRIALLDDMEGMLEAERMALELERRDLYTARCRHWFGVGN